jgi:hypothetical protein
MAVDESWRSFEVGRRWSRQGQMIRWEAFIRQGGHVCAVCVVGAKDKVPVVGTEGLVYSRCRFRLEETEQSRKQKRQDTSRAPVKLEASEALKMTARWRISGGVLGDGKSRSATSKKGISRKLMDEAEPNKNSHSHNQYELSGVLI